MLTDSRVEQILARIPTLTVGVVGDLFLDRYLDIDGSLTEPSIETGLDAYQVTRVRSYPGAAGTVINNLVALGVKRVCAVSVIGDDGEGYELRQALAGLRVVDSANVISAPDRRTPTYTKPLLHEAGEPPRELNRLDIKDRTPLPRPLQDLLMGGLVDVWPQVNALLVLDQVSEECGVVTTRLRRRLAQLSAANPAKFILADSRARIGLFRNICVKPNLSECLAAVWVKPPKKFTKDHFAFAPLELARVVGGAVFCTNGKHGIAYVPRPSKGGALHRYDFPAYPVSGPIDPVGAGDSTSAAIACAVASGASLEEAAAFGNLVASITIQQLGTTGTATPQQVRQRWREVRASRA